MTWRRSVLVVVIAIVVAGCASVAPTNAPSIVAGPSPSSDRVSGWRGDIGRIIPGLVELHPDPFHGITQGEFQSAINALSVSVPTASDDTLMTRVMRAIALVSVKGRDGHTGAFVWGEGTYPLHSLPLRLWVFPDGIHVVAALPPYEDLVGARITSVAGHPIDEVLEALEPLIPRDNDETVTLLEPRLILIPEILHGLGLVADPTSLELGLIGGGAGPTDRSVAPVSMADYNAWATPYGLDLPADPKVRWLSRSTETLWFEDLDPATVYVQYNRVQAIGAATLDALTTRLRAPGLGRVIVDIRNNYGGEKSALAPVLAAFEPPSLPAGVRVSLLTGRNTFSAGSMFEAALQAARAVTVVGEPASGAPTFWANSRPISLPWSGIVIEVSTSFEVATSADDPRVTIVPDVPIALTAADYFARRDPVLEAALAGTP